MKKLLLASLITVSFTSANVMADKDRPDWGPGDQNPNIPPMENPIEKPGFNGDGGYDGPKPPKLPIGGNPERDIERPAPETPDLPDHMPSLPTPNNPIEDGKPGQGPEGEATNPIQDTGRIDEAKDAATSRVNDAQTRADSVETRVDNLEAGFQQMANDMLGLEERMDGVVASSHAIVNARPMVSTAGEFAVGVGMGYAGSKEAIALGGAYAFNENWSASATFNYETSGQYSSSQVSGGAGVQYKF